MKKRYDAIIVGGGPAGSSAALYASKIDLKTIILDKSDFPRDKICGDALSGKCVKYMEELNLINGLKFLKGCEINRITFGSPSHKQFDVHLNNSYNEDTINRGYVIPRENFDNYLFNEASKVSDVKKKFEVKDIIKDDSLSVIGIRGINESGKIEEIYAPIILGCDGANSVISKKLGSFLNEPQNTSVALRCYYKNIKNLTDQIELHFVNEVLPGYFWLFPSGNNIANVGIGMTKEALKKDGRSLNEILNQVIKSAFFKNRFKDAIPLEKPKGWPLPLGRIRRKSFGDGFMLLGDAAGLIDPFTGEGIGNAMASAKIAVKTIQKCKNTKDYSSENTYYYQKEIWNLLGAELKTSSKLQDLSKYKRLLNFVINRGAKNPEVQDLITGMLANAIPKSKLSNPFFYLNLLFK